VKNFICISLLNKHDIAILLILHLSLRISLRSPRGTRTIYNFFNQKSKVKDRDLSYRGFNLLIVTTPMPVTYHIKVST